MAISIGINGFGRIGRVALRIAISRPETFKLCGINARNADLDYMVYMIRYDSTFGRFQGELGTYEHGLIINGQKIPVFTEGDAASIPWGSCGAEYIIDATGAFCTAKKASAHLQGCAKKVIISAPAKDEETPTFIMGINQTGYSKDMSVVSNASCTTNCLAPICKVLEDNYGIEYGLMSTIHAATAKQKVVDSRSLKDWRTGRSAFGNLIPSTTGAAKAISLVIPSLKDKMSGISYRVPTTDVSIVDLNVALKESASYEDICKKVKEASMTYLSGILAICFTFATVPTSNRLSILTSLFSASFFATVKTIWSSFIAASIALTVSALATSIYAVTPGSATTSRSAIKGFLIIKLLVSFLFTDILCDRFIVKKRVPKSSPLFYLFLRNLILRL